MADEIVLVAGMNFAQYKSNKRNKREWHFVPASSGPWRECCFTWAQRALNADPTLRVTLFDFFTGTKETLKSGGKGKKPATKLVGDPKPLVPGNYRRLVAEAGLERLLPIDEGETIESDDEPMVFYYTGIGGIWPGEATMDDYVSADSAGDARLAEDSISVTWVYDYIREIGDQRAGALIELHFFTHSWSEGPVFVNTNDNLLRYRNVAFARDPLDKDCRSFKDFERLNMRDPAAFKKAFAAGATCRVWGCNADRFWKHLILETREQIRHKALKDENENRFQFVYHPDKNGFDKDWRADEDVFHGRLNGSAVDHKSGLMSFKQIKDLLQNELGISYSNHLAPAAGCRVLGAVPGTGTNPDTRADLGLLLLHVPMGDAYAKDSEDDYRPVMEFYKKYFGIAFDPHETYDPKYGRGYAVFQ